MKSAFALPAWIPVEAWREYEVMRNLKHRPMTDYARHLAVKKLERLKDEGYDPVEVLNQSIFECWQGLFPVKDQESNHGWDSRKAAMVGVWRPQ